MAPGRGADVPKAHFAKLHKDLVDVVLVCDRYSAYKWVAYLLLADNVSRLLPCCLREVNQPVIRTRNRFSKPRPALLVCIWTHIGHTLDTQRHGSQLLSVFRLSAAGATVAHERVTPL